MHPQCSAKHGHHHVERTVISLGAWWCLWCVRGWGCPARLRRPHSPERCSSPPSGWRGALWLYGFMAFLFFGPPGPLSEPVLSSELSGGWAASGDPSAPQKVCAGQTGTMQHLQRWCSVRRCIAVVSQTHALSPVITQAFKIRNLCWMG